MGARLDPTVGFALFETRFNPDTLAAVGVGANDSAYTEAGPIPGHPEPADAASRWRPMIRGAQSVDLTALTIHPGFPGRDPAAAVVYRLGSDTDQGDYRGWSEPNLLTDWTAPEEYQDENWDVFAACAIPDTSRVVVVAIPAGNNTGTAWRYDLRTGVWTALGLVAAQGLHSPISMAYDTSTSRLLLWSGNGDPYEPSHVAYQSTDEGDNWTIYARGFYDAAVAAGESASVAVDDTGDWIMFADNQQFASSDHGATWETIDAAPDGLDHRVVRVPAGYLVSYNRSADNNAVVKLLPTARSVFSDAADVVVSAIVADDINLACDFDGSAYCYVSGPLDGQVHLYRSDDSGRTWNAYIGCLTAGAAGAIGTGRWGVAVPVGGSILLIGNHLGTPTNGIHALVMGGYSQVDQGYFGALAAYNQVRTSRFPFAAYGTVYMPFDTPTNMGWTTTSTGTISMAPAGTDVGLSLITTAGQVCTHVTSIDTGISITYGCGGAKLRVLSGAGQATTPVVIQMLLQDGAATGYTLQIRIGTDGIEVRDGAVTVRANSTLTTSLLTHIRWQMRHGGADVWYKQGNGSVWTQIADNVTLTSGVVATSAITFGHSTGAASSIWHYCGASYYSDWRYELTGAGASLSTPADALLGLSAGRPVPGRGAAYPIPDATTASEAIGYITAVGGPTWLTESVELPAGHTYAVEHVYPDESPSPRVQWRTTDTALVHLTWDQGSGKASWFGGALALAVLNAQPRTFVLEIDDNAGGWTTLGTLDKGWGSINYTLTGASLSPRASTATIDRYIHEGELVGGYVVCSTAGVSVARRIVRNSGGYWSTSSTLQQVRIGLDHDEIDGTETASGTGEIVHHSGVMVVYRTTDPPRRRMRIRIAASQITPGGYYAAGIAGVARVVGVGNAPGWGWTNRTDFSRTIRRAADGSPIVRENGPPRRVWSRGWPDGVQLKTMRLLASDAPRIEISGTAPIGTKDDTWTAPVAWIEQYLRSGEVPSLLIPQLPLTSGTTITDPSGYLYGSLESDGVGMTAFAGHPGVDEVLRVDSISFEEIR